MALDAQCKAFLDMLAASGGKPLEHLPLEEARLVPRALIELGGPVQSVARVENRAIPGPAQPIPLRVYWPTLAPSVPALMFFHGGGFVICNLESHDRQCRALANESGCVVISVDYRLAPEHKFPAAPEDAYAATRYVAEHAAEFSVDPARIAVGGYSAGGNLAAVVSLMARDRGGPALRFQLLIYPAVDWEDQSPSMREFGTNHFLTLESHGLVRPPVRNQPGGAAPPVRLALERAGSEQSSASHGHHRRVRPAARSGRGLRPEAAGGRCARPVESVRRHDSPVLQPGRHHRRGA